MADGTRAGWRIVTHMRVLGVAMTDPLTLSTPDGVGPLVAKLEERVSEPLRVLIRELDAGQDRAVAFFLARRYVLPNLMFQCRPGGCTHPPTRGPGWTWYSMRCPPDL